MSALGTLQFCLSLLCIWHHSVAALAQLQGYLDGEPLLADQAVQSLSHAGAGASAALKAAAEKLDDVQRGAGELYAKFAEKASTKVHSPNAAVCPRALSITGTT